MTGFSLSLPRSDTSVLLAVAFRRPVALADAAGLLRRIQPSGSVARYESRVGDNHHHVVCRSCGAIADVDCAVHSAPCLAASNDHGFAIDEAEVTYWALCPECAGATSHQKQTAG